MIRLGGGDRELLSALAALTLVSGVVDAVSYLGLGRVFTANMTGNVVLLGFAAAQRLGLPIQTVIEALQAGPLVSGWQAAKLQRISDGDFSAQFALSLALKDVGLALQAAGNEGFPALACLAAEWQGAVDQGLGEQDLTVVTRIL